MEILILDYFIIEAGIGEIQPLVENKIIVEAPLEINEQLRAIFLLLPRVQTGLLQRSNLNFLKRSKLKITE